MAPMRDFDRALPPSDRQDEPDPMPRETALARVRRLCREMGLPVPPDESEGRVPGEEG